MKTIRFHIVGRSDHFINSTFFVPSPSRYVLLSEVRCQKCVARYLHVLRAVFSFTPPHLHEILTNCIVLFLFLHIV